MLREYPILTALQDTVVQTGRFQIFEEVGCLSSTGNFGLEVLLLDSLPIIPPLISLTLYSRKSFQMLSYPIRH